jgi:hypothetical protein
MAEEGLISFDPVLGANTLIVLDFGPISLGSVFDVYCVV